VKPGDRVALAMKNYPEWCIGYMAAVYCGAVIVPLNSFWTEDELEYGFRDSGTKVLIADSERYQRAVPALDKLSIHAILVRGDEKKLRGAVAKNPPERWENVLKAGNGKAHIVPGQPDEAFAIMYTSGTTGHPKGVVQTQRGAMHQLLTLQLSTVLGAQLGEILKVPVDPDWPCVICPIPLFHVTGCHHVFLASFFVGRKTVLMTRWDPTEALKLITKERPTGWTGVPTMVQDIMEHPDFSKTDFSSIKQMGGGGAPTPKAQVLRVEKNFSIARPAQGYGLTETNGAIAIISGDSYLLKPGSTGQPYPCVEVRVVDLDTGKDVGVGERGELLIRGPLVMKEYWNKPKATSEVLSPDGWFRSGDVAIIDEEGFIFIVDRAKDIIIRGGENISCAEVESAIHSHASVHEVAVFALPDERLGERPAAMIMLKEGKHLRAEELPTFLKPILASFKIPKQQDIFFTHEPLPRGATGKTQKRDIKASVIKMLQEKSPPRSKL